MMSRYLAPKAFKSPGQKGQELLAQNAKLKLKIAGFDKKLLFLRQKYNDNLYKAKGLLIEEKQSKKFKVD